MNALHSVGTAPDSYIVGVNELHREPDMSKATGRIKAYLHHFLVIYVFGMVINGVSSQLSASPVVVRESQTARFRWQVPAVTDGSTLNTLYVISPSGTPVLVVNTVNNNHQTAPDYTARVTYTGNLAANPRIMAFDLRSVGRSDAGDYVCGRNGPSVIIPQCGQKLVVPGPDQYPMVYNQSPLHP